MPDQVRHDKHHLSIFLNYDTAWKAGIQEIFPCLTIKIAQFRVLLFLSMNHPNQYPNFIPFKEFSKQFNIDPLDLEFNVRQIVEKEIYPVDSLS